MRRVYRLENEKELAWGFDHTGGFFVQVFDESDDNERLILNADQGEALSPFSIGDERLTYEKMVNTLSQYSQKALNDFTNLMNQSFEAPLIGYAYNENGMYKEKVFINTKKNLFEFIDQIQHDYTITDIGDLEVDLRSVKQLVVAL